MEMKVAGISSPTAKGSQKPYLALLTVLHAVTCINLQVFHFAPVGVPFCPGSRGKMKF